MIERSAPRSAGLAPIVAVEGAIVDGFGEVFGGDGRGGGKVGDGAGDLEDAVVAAGGEALAGHRPFEQGFAGGIERAELADLAGRHCGIGEDALAPKAFELSAAGFDNAFADVGGWLGGAVRAAAELGEFYGRHVDVDIDAVHQRAGDLADITLDLHRRALALAARAEVAARARVHRGDEREICRKGQRRGGPRDGHLFVLHRLPQDLKHAAVKLREFVEKEHAEMCQRDLAGLWHRAATDQPGLRDGVVRRLERAFGDEAAPAGKPGDGMDLCDLKRLFKFERRQYGREPLGEHRFARARRADEEYVMAAGGGNLESTLGGLLAADLGEIGTIRVGVAAELVLAEHKRRDAGRLAGDELRGERGGLFQAPHRKDIYTTDDRRLLGVLFRDEQVGKALFAGGESDRERTADRPDATIKRKLADAQRIDKALAAAEVGICPEHAERDRQVKARTFFADVRRSEVHRRLQKWEKEAAIINRRTYPLARFADRRIRQPDDGYVVLVLLAARRPQVHLNIDHKRVNAINRGRFCNK